MEFICIGKIVNTHGIKGELRLLSKFEFKERVFKKGVEVFIGREKISEVIKSYRHHKCFEMITLEGYTNINEVLKYKGKLCYVKRDVLNLSFDEFLDNDLIDLDVIVNGKVSGKVIKLERITEKNAVLWVLCNNREIAIPYVEKFVKINILNSCVIIQPIEGMFD